MEDSNMIFLSTLIQRNEAKFLANKLGEEMVMMNMENGDFISMNNVGADIWNLLQEPISIQALIKKLIEVYSITEEQCINETMQFLQKSKQQNLFIFHNK